MTYRFEKERSEDQIRRRGWVWLKREEGEADASAYDAACDLGAPFIIVVDPYGKNTRVIFEMDPCGHGLNIAAVAQIKRLAQNAVERSKLPKRSIRVSQSTGSVRWMTADIGRAFADELVTILYDTTNHTDLPPPPSFRSEGVAS